MNSAFDFFSSSPLVSLFFFILISSPLNVYTQPLPPSKHDHEHHYHDDTPPISEQQTKEQLTQSQRRQRLLILDRTILENSEKRAQITKKLDRFKIQRTKLKAEIQTLSHTLQNKQETVIKGLLFKKKLKSARLAEVLLSADGPITLKRRL